MPIDVTKAFQVGGTGGNNHGICLTDNFWTGGGSATPTHNAPQNSVYYKENGVVYRQINSGMSNNWKILPGSAGNTRVVLFDTPSGGGESVGTYSVQSVGGTGTSRISFMVPGDFSELVSVKTLFIVSSGAAGSGKNIDITTSYSMFGEAHNTNEEEDASSTYDFTGTTNKLASIDITSLFSSILPCHICSVESKHNSIGGSLHYIGLLLEYR